MFQKIVDPYVGLDKKVTATAAPISYILNPDRPIADNIQQKIRMLKKFKQINKKANERFFIRWEVKNNYINNLAVRGDIKPEQLAAVNRIAEKATGISSLFAVV